MKQYPDIARAIKCSKEFLYQIGQKVESRSWQGKSGEFDTLEVLNYSFQSPIPAFNNLVPQVKPNLPWADVHFEERISGVPYNPPPSHELWPYAKVNGNNLEHMKGGVFSHTYPERMWPKYAKVHGNPMFPIERAEEAKKLFNPTQGIRYELGDYDGVIEMLKRDPTTRQAYLPIWFPEDTGAPPYQRTPCTLGYWFVQRFGYLHITYYIRSCDIVRHFRDDIYLTLRLLYHTCQQAFNNVKPGAFTMHIGSLHCFWNERHILLKDKT